MRVLKRVLTRKSILGFGRFEHRDLSVQMLLDLKQQNILINAYYGLEKIDFIPDILDELGIVNEFIIEKPGKNHEMRKTFYVNKLSNLTEEQKMGKYQKKNALLKRIYKRKNASRYTDSPEYLRSKNHNNMLRK
jgi:hypothetical protein